PSYKHATRFRHAHFPWNRQNVFVIPRLVVRIWHHESEVVILLFKSPSKRQFQSLTAFFRETSHFLHVLEVQRNPRNLANRLQHSALHRNRFGVKPPSIYDRVELQLFSFVTRFLSNLHERRSLRPIRFDPLHDSSHPASDLVVPIVFFAASDLRELGEPFADRWIELFRD